MRCRSFVAGATLALLGGGFAAANEPLSPETKCNNGKIHASAEYYSCLLQVEARDNANRLLRAKAKAIAACDADYKRSFKRAERSAGVRCSPPDPEAALEIIKAQAVAATGTCTNISEPCESLTARTEGSQTSVACIVKSTACGLALADVIGQAQAQFPNFVIGDSSILWIQAWAAWGAGGNGSENSSAFGVGGYAQTITTVADFKSAHNKSTQLYYYLGESGGHPSDSGGQGASSTMVTLDDLTVNPTQDPQVDQIYLVAGGGGGGGGDNASSICIGSGSKPGGAGGIAIATTAASGSGNGQAGTGGGQGGTEGSGSGGGSGDGFGGPGGENGRSSLGRTGWSNTGTTGLTFTAGEGGNGGDADCSCASGGGGGGGGWGGGGGGSHACDATSGAGGGGASYAIRSTRADNCALQPSTSTTPPLNPISPFGTGPALQITINLTPNVCG
ncbi:MAG: hypothetical protein AB7U38_06750 [Hyphomicrobiales bacterium]